MIDLHTHSTASDGALSPTELLTLAKKNGLKALALTDHDTVAGIAEARLRSTELSIVLIPGVEIEIEFDPGEFHLLGLGIDETNDELLNALSVLAEARRDRNSRIVELFKSDGISSTSMKSRKSPERNASGDRIWPRLSCDVGS